MSSQREGAHRALRVSTPAWTSALLTLLFLAAWSATGARAQELPAPTEAGLDSALAVELSRIEGAPLSLKEAIRAALEGGSTVARRAAAALAAARGAARRERGAFDPELFLDATWSERDETPTNPFEQVDVLSSRTTIGAGGARMLLPFGTELEASMNAIRNETNASFASVNPSYDAEGRISVRQPLLRGLGPGTGSEANAAAREEEAAKARYDDAIHGVRAVVEQAYWDLYAAERDLAVQRLVRDQASALVTQAELRERAGLVGPGDVANARVFRAEQTQAVLDREEELDRISDRLASLIGRRPAGGVARFRPTDEPPASVPTDGEEVIVARALAENRELQARERDLAAARARERGAAWNRFPKLDLIGSLGGTGLAGTPQDPGIPGAEPVDVSGKFGEAWSQAIHREFPTWSAGVTLSVPLLLREGRGEHERLRAETDRARQDYEEARRALEEEVRAAHRALVRAGRRLEAAREGVTASREQVRIGVLQYRSGRTTAFELVRLGADLASAQQRYSQALVRTAKAAAALRFLTSGAVPGPEHEGSDRP